VVVFGVSPSVEFSDESFSIDSSAVVSSVSFASAELASVSFSVCVSSTCSVDSASEEFSSVATESSVVVAFPSESFWVWDWSCSPEIDSFCVCVLFAPDWFWVWFCPAETLLSSLDELFVSV
jgi:hypothetical protein